MTKNKCVMCGDEIPEGRQVCYCCEGPIEVEKRAPSCSPESDDRRRSSAAKLDGNRKGKRWIRKCEDVSFSVVERTKTIKTKLT